MKAVSHRRPRTRAGAHTRSTVGTAAPDVATLLKRIARRLQRAQLHYGHGTDNPHDDAAALIWHVMDLPVPANARTGRRRPTAAQRARLEQLVRRRIRERVPVVYLTQRCWFAGLALHVDQRVLIPRSPIAELIERGFAPWIDPRRVRRVLDLGTGSGCIAIACARALPRARVDALDVSPDALDVTRINIRAHRLARRVRPVLSDHFSALADERYDIIVSNPPYVGRAEMASLPAEYGHEPRLALAAGRDGLDSARVILREAARWLNPDGILVVEVGNSERSLRRAFPRLPFTWLEFARGGGGVFMLTRAQLES